MTKNERLLVCKYITAIEYLSEVHHKQVLETIKKQHRIRGALWKIRNTFVLGIYDSPNKEQLNAILEEYGINQNEFTVYLKKSRLHWQRVKKASVNSNSLNHQSTDEGNKV